MFSGRFGPASKSGLFDHVPKDDNDDPNLIKLVDEESKGHNQFHRDLKPRDPNDVERYNKIDRTEPYDPNASKVP